MIEQPGGEITSLILMALAISMDGFSIGIGLGMQNLQLKKRAIISLMFGIFHMMIPLLGILMGKILSAKIGKYTAVAGGFLLFSLGVYMILNTLLGKSDHKSMQSYGSGLFLLAFSVSIDSFPVGLSLGLSGVQVFIALFLFGTLSAWLTWIALYIGNHIQGTIGPYSEILGGSILVAFGLKIIFLN